MNDKKLKKLVTASLLAALTCIATMIIKFPTPTLGYIHLGDCFVLLCGIVLGPQTGALAAGIGSMFSDLFSGYALWAPATLVIKALTAAAAGFLFRKMQRCTNAFISRFVSVIAGGIAGEAVMVIGYFLYETAIAALGTGSISAAVIAAGVATAAAGIPFNIVQGLTGIVLSTLLLPILLRISDVREWTCQNLAKQ